MNIPDIKAMVRAGVHFGHKPSKRHPSMDQYILSVRNNVHIFDLEKTQTELKKALDFIKAKAQSGSTILFVGTKKQAKDMVKKYAESAQMPYVTEKWLGGTITNFEVINALVKKLKRLEEQAQDPHYEEKYTKKERQEFRVAGEKLETMISGIKNMDKLPGVLYLVGACDERTAIREARHKNIPTLAICDTNSNANQITFPIPANDDAIKSIDLITGLVIEAIKEGKKEAGKVAEEASAETKNNESKNGPSGESE